MAKKILLDEIIGTEDEIDHSIPSPEDSLQGKELEESVRKVLETLTPTEEKILRMRFGVDEKTDIIIEEIGQKFAVTRERIRQLEAKALQRLRKNKKSS